MKKLVLVILMGLAMINCVGCGSKTESKEVIEVKTETVVEETKVDEVKKPKYVDNEYQKEFNYNSEKNVYTIK